MQKQPLLFQNRQNECETYQQIIDLIQNQHQINHLTEHERLDQIKLIMLNESHIMSSRNRWILNNSIVQIIDGILTTRIQHISNQIQENIPIIKRMQEKVDKDILQTSDIVAMTTTGVAKFKKLINRVDSKIMIVEEAAQILESHMATSLTPKIEHLILIGDHEQLRPSNNVYELSKKYNLDISMFERFVNNNFENVMLKNQRRMRPQISEIMRQIYPNLEDDPMVHSYPDIRGINNRNYIFFNHEFPEDQIQNLQTKTNPKEADIIVRFTAYLLQQNYKPEQITILSLYTGQLLRIKQCVIKSYPQKENPIRQVKIVTVDNYQGEENDIVILSLVRSNHQDNIGFLQASNRVCVALSRARYGMFIFGNAQCLRNAAIKINKKEKVDVESQRQEHLWLRVLQVLNNRGDLLQQLELKCNNHGNVTVIKDAKDFDKVPEGGCKEICKVRMQCGHSCESFCHIYEITETNQTGHDHIRCNKPCTRPRDCDHPCSYMCYDCKEKQKPCKVEVKKKLNCDHTNQYKCSEVSDNNECQKRCEKSLGCGHICQKLCKFDCNELGESLVNKGYRTTCKERIEKRLPCGHWFEIDCGLPVDKYLEKNPCKIEIQKNIPCGHTVLIPCWQNPEEFYKKNGCKVPCNGILECDHPCPNKCSECHLKNFHGMCNKNCGRLNICNHECKDKCSEKCPPCKKHCPQKCSHSLCTQKCGEVCYQCTEPCSIKCKHSSCSKLCYELCDRKPCQEPCDNMLLCGHPCIGFCGETCPTSCRVPQCKSYDESTFEILFGMEDDEDARFVQLEDCSHAIEAEALRQCFKNGLSADGSIKYLECPKCKSHVRNCQRYQDFIKGTQQRVDTIKYKILQELGNLKHESINFNKNADLQKSIETFVLNHKSSFITSIMLNFSLLIKLCKSSLNNFQIKKLSAMEIQTLSFQLNCISQFMKQIENYLQKFVPTTQLFKMIELLSSFFEQLQHKRLHEKRFKAIEQMLKVFSFCLQIHSASLEADSDGQNSPTDLVEVFKISIQKKFFISEAEFKAVEAIVSKHKEFIKYDGKNFQEMIIKAIGLSSGHWYTCQKGHVYAIGDCGQAMQESKCPECGSKIGGTGHHLEESNRQIRFGQSGQIKDFHAGDEDLARRIQNQQI